MRFFILTPSSSSSSSSSSFSIFNSRREIQEGFARELDALAKMPEAEGLVKRIIEGILKGKDIAVELEGASPELLHRVRVLWGMFGAPPVTGTVNTVAIQALRGDMREILEGKLLELKMTSIWKEVPPHRIALFKARVEGFYGKALSEGKSPKEALTFALAKGLIHMVVSNLIAELIEKDPEIKKKVDEDRELQNYKCGITLDLPWKEDFVYLETIDPNTGRVHKQYYDRFAISSWIDANHTDPITRQQRGLEDIKTDLGAREFIESRFISLVYPYLEVDPNCSQNIPELQSTSFLLAVKAAYVEINKEYLIGLQGIVKPYQVFKEDIYARRTIQDCIDLVEGVDFEKAGVTLQCYPYAAEFIRVTGEKLREWMPLKEAKEEFVRKLDDFLAAFYGIKGLQLKPYKEKQVIGRVGEAIAQGVNLQGVRDILIEYLDEVNLEETIRERFPGCLRGAEEWSVLGEVEDLSIPKGVLEILEERSVGLEGYREGAKIGDTHMLLLIPKTVNGKPFTLEILGELVKSKGYLQKSKNGFSYIIQGITSQEVSKSYYVLISKGLLVGSRNKSYENQEAMVANFPIRPGIIYKVPRVIEVAAAAYLEYVIFGGGVRLFSSKSLSYTRCEDVVKGSHMVVGGFAGSGLEFHNYHYAEPMGIAAALRELS